MVSGAPARRKKAALIILGLMACVLAACGGQGQSTSVSGTPAAGTVAPFSYLRPASAAPQGPLSSEASRDHFERNPPIEPARAPAKRIVQDPELRPNVLAQGRRALRQASSGTTLDCNVDMPNVYALTGNALLERLASYSLDCMDSSAAFFALNSNTYTLYSNANMQTVAEAVVTRTAMYSPADGQSIRQFLTYLRAGAYAAYYSGGILTHSAQTIAKITDALRVFSQTPYFLDLSKDHGNVIYDYVTLANDYDETRAMFAPTALAYLAAMIANTGSSNYGLYSAQNGIYYLL